jgi:hypothetical protein
MLAYRLPPSRDHNRRSLHLDRSFPRSLLFRGARPCRCDRHSGPDLRAHKRRCGVPRCVRDAEATLDNRHAPRNARKHTELPAGLRLSFWGSRALDVSLRFACCKAGSPYGS